MLGNFDGESKKMVKKVMRENSCFYLRILRMKGAEGFFILWMDWFYIGKGWFVYYIRMEWKGWG